MTGNPLNLSLPLSETLRIRNEEILENPSETSEPSGRKSVSSDSGVSLNGDEDATTASTKPRPRKRNLPCEFCGKSFDRPSLLSRHLRTHTGERPHVCNVCTKAFSTSSSLNTHKRIHSGEKPHQCKTCGKKFTASSNLYYHKMTHIKVIINL